jgi:hypothetical protein
MQQEHAVENIVVHAHFVEEQIGFVFIQTGKAANGTAVNARLTIVGTVLPNT